jgi:hypothetical protein
MEIADQAGAPSAACVLCARTVPCVRLSSGAIIRPTAWVYPDETAPLVGVCGGCQDDLASAIVSARIPSPAIECCARVPANCIVCDRAVCIACRSRVANWPRDRGFKTAVLACSECDPDDRFASGKINDHERRAILERTGQRVAVQPHLDNTGAECRNVGPRTLVLSLRHHDCCFDCNEAGELA